MCESVGRVTLNEGHRKTVSSLEKKRHDSARGELKNDPHDQNHLPALLVT